MRAGPLDPHLQLRLEQDAFEALQPGIQQLSIWQPQHSLVVTATEARLPTFVRAEAAARARGIPIAVRSTGGGAVCLGPGTLVVSHLSMSASNDIRATYESFSRRLINAFAGMGVELVAEQVARAYCDGRFDLSWQARKVGGVAQRRSLYKGSTRIWIHAVLSIDHDSRRYPEEVERFYADLAVSRVADPLAATTLVDCLPPEVPRSNLLDRCAAAIAEQFEPSCNGAISDPPSLPMFA